MFIFQKEIWNHILSQQSVVNIELHIEHRLQVKRQKFTACGEIEPPMRLRSNWCQNQSGTTGNIHLQDTKTKREKENGEAMQSMNSLITAVSFAVIRDYFAHVQTYRKEEREQRTMQILEPDEASQTKTSSSKVSIDLPKQKTACHATVGCLQSIHSFDPVDYAHQTQRHLSAKLFCIWESIVKQSLEF